MRRSIYFCLFLLIAAVAYAVMRFMSVTILPGGDYQLSTVPDPTPHVVDLVPGNVQHFTLTANGDANSHRIVGEIPGVSSGDGLTYSQPAGGDFTGSYPNPTLVNVPTYTATAFLPILLTAGTCVDTPVVVTGADFGMVATVSLPGTPSGLVGSAWPDSLNSVTVRLCSIVDFFTLIAQVNIGVVR